MGLGPEKTSNLTAGSKPWPQSANTLKSKCQMRFSILVGIFLSFVTFGLTQSSTKKVCYQKEFMGDEKIFNRMDVHPNYRGYTDKLNQFLINQINLDKILNSMLENTRLLIDTVDVRFVVSKTKQMSNLSVVANNKVVQEEIRQALIQSSCNWEPGSSSGRYLNGWFENKLVMTFDRRGRFLLVKIEWLDSFAK